MFSKSQPLSWKDDHIQLIGGKKKEKESVSDVSLGNELQFPLTFWMDWKQSELSPGLVSNYLLLRTDQWHVAANTEWQLLMEVKRKRESAYNANKALNKN